jgi:N-acetylglucosamine kinase-like BadF-type ATPase
MNESLYIMGIDSGGTKTSAVLCSCDGMILSEAQGSPSNLHLVGLEKTASTILDLIQTCTHSVGCSVSQIGAVVAGVAGAGGFQDQQHIMEKVQGIALSRDEHIEKF